MLELIGGNADLLNDLLLVKIMGQAKQRGDFEQRKIQAVANDLEKQRLDGWLRARQPKTKPTDRSRLIMLSAMLAMGDAVYPIELRNHYQ